MYKHNSSGFTMVEVVLFFAVSSALMLGIISGVSSTISRQHYNDTVNDFSEYLRDVYSNVQNVDNSKFYEGVGATATAGRSDQAIYGRLLVFGNDSGKRIDSYVLVGKIINGSYAKVSDLTYDDGAGNQVACPANADTLTLLRCTDTKILSDTNKSSYPLVWGGFAENPNSNTAFSSCVLVARSPLSGAVHTYVSADPNCGNLAASSFASFTEADINICIDSEDNTNKVRRNLRIHAGAANSSAIDLPALNSAYSAANPNGSSCSTGNEASYAGNLPG